MFKAQIRAQKIAWARQLRKSGATYREIAEIVGVSMRAVQEWLRQPHKRRIGF